MNAVTESFLPAADTGVVRLITAGSVDDGKSTLIGRLLYDSKSVYADQLDAIARAKYKRVSRGDIDFALLTDGLEAEREQGITIDVAYRYFATPRRKFIIADAPGHEQYTRNMVTGASTADVAVILIDASRVVDGRLLPQTKRHSTIARLLGIRHIVVAVNKMDLVGWDQAVFDRIRHAYAELADRVGIASFQILPMSALDGDNVVRAAPDAPWYEGPPLLALLEALHTPAVEDAASLRLPVQWVLRHDGSSANDFRGYAGRIVSGVLRQGDAVVVQPGEVNARVASLSVHDKSLSVAHAGDSVTVVLDRDIDVSRGDMLAHPQAPANVTRTFEAELCWLDTQPLNPARRYLLKHGSRLTSARVDAVLSRRDMHELIERADMNDDGGSLAMNDIARVRVLTRDPLPLDRYDDLRATGAFILIDEATHQTAAAGMVR